MAVTDYERVAQANYAHDLVKKSRVWQNASDLDITIIEETKKVLKCSASATTLKAGLKQLGWSQVKNTTFLLRLFVCNNKMMFATLANVAGIESGIVLEVFMVNGRASCYRLMKKLTSGRI